jgi:hypothetical protein
MLDDAHADGSASLVDGLRIDVIMIVRPIVARTDCAAIGAC